MRADVLPDYHMHEDSFKEEEKEEKLCFLKFLLILLLKDEQRMFSLIYG